MSIDIGGSAFTPNLPAKNNSGAAVVLGDVVMYELNSAGDGLNIITPVVAAATPENLLAGTGVVVAPSGHSVLVGDFCMVARFGPAKVRVNGSGTAIGITDVLLPQNALHLAVTRAAQPDLVGGDGSIVTASALAGASSTAEVAFDRTIVIPANALQAGDIVRIRAQGIVVAQNGTPALTVRLRIGGNDIATSPAIAVSAADVFNIDSVVTIRTDGAAGTLVASSLGQGPDAPATITAWGDILASTGSFNTTAAVTVDATVQFGAGHASNTVRLDTLAVQVVRPNAAQIKSQVFAIALEASTSADAVIDAFLISGV